MNHNSSWDDLRYVLAVAEAGSVNAAAKQLGVNHATVLRRIAGFEDRHGVTLFERTARGTRVSPETRPLLEAARAVQSAVHGVERVLSGHDSALRGRVRVTSTDTIMQYVLPRLIGRFRKRAPEVFVDLVCTNAHLDLSRLDAEVTVRPALGLPKGLRGAAPARLGFAAYEPVGALPPAAGWVGLGGTLSRSVAGQWMADEVPPDRIVARSDSFVVACEMAAAGIGRVLLPCVVGDADQRLVRSPDRGTDISVDLWVASHADMADVPRIRAVREALIEGLAADRDRLAG